MAKDPIEELVVAMRDARRSRLRPRTVPLVVTELQQLETLLRVTPPEARDHPMLLRRIAEDYAELETAAAPDPRKVEAARAGAIRAYSDLLATRLASYPLVDEVEYYLALEYERAGELPSARRLYLELITRSPASRYVPLAYFAFGEAFWREAQADPSKLDLAKEAFLEVTKSPPPDDRAFGWAWIRLGQVAEKQGDRNAAANAYHHAEDYAREYPQVPGASITVAIPAWVEGVTGPTVSATP